MDTRDRLCAAPMGGSKKRRWTRAGVAVVPALCLILSAGAAWRAVAEHHDPASATPAAAGFEAEDHFPGAALVYAVDDDAAPAPGTTGTTALPTAPIPANAAQVEPLDATVRPAAPFRLGAASSLDRGRALECLAAAIYYEAASESDDGQRAVAQVVLNRVRHPAFPATVCGVVYQGSEARGCQFSFACDGATAREPSRAGWLRALRIASAALAGQVFAPVGLATHYHTYAVTPAWNRALVMTDVVGAHFFHRWKGYWGTAAAFHQVYAGGEPLPEPHSRPLAPTLQPVVALAALPANGTSSVGPPSAAAPAAAALFQQPQPAYVDSGTARTPAAAAPDDGSSQILDKWKDSGQPLR